MGLFGRRDKSSVPDPAPGLSELLERLRTIESELRELRLQLEFIRTRASSYVGDGIALTYMADETPIFVNANDFGGPFNLINGGRYEEENVEVLMSFVRDDTIFLDIGANVGLYTLKVGRRLCPKGKVYAFEPNPQLHELLSRNVYVNGLTGRIQSFRLGLSDRNGTATFQYPTGHLGGGHIGTTEPVAGHVAVGAEIRRLDDLLGNEFRCDLVKIDVEGHELSVLNGMKGIILNSPSIKILFEKLECDAPNDVLVEAFFAELGFALYGVCPDASLAQLASGALSRWSGYVFAARFGTIDGGLRRARFSVYGGQLFKPNSPQAGVAEQRAGYGQMLFHGPYWFLPAGVWRLKVYGEIRGTVCFGILERFGHPFLKFLIEEGKNEHVFVVPRNLVHFECAAFAATPEAEIKLERVEFIREG